MSSFSRLAASLGMVSLLALGLAKASPAFACSCLPVESAQAGMDMSDAVFQGTVEDVTRGQMNNEVTFAVSSSWKGDGAEELKVTTARDSAACGINFEVGKEYLVYADQGEDGLTAGLCSRTALATDAQEDITEFSRIDSHGNLPPVADTGMDQVDPKIVIIATGAFFAGFLIAYLLWGRNMKQ